MRNVPEKKPLILEAGQRAIGMKEAAHLIYPYLYYKRLERGRVRTGEHVGERQRSWLPPDHTIYKLPHGVLSLSKSVGVAGIFGVRPKLEPI